MIATPPKTYDTLPPEPGQPGSPFAPGWTLHRRQQITTLQTLLNELTVIDRGSNAIARLQRCIAMAEELRHDDLAGLTPSFPSFLTGLALNKATVEDRP